jgi:hypothetical protein
MKYQDASFENAFWKQLLEMEDEWKEAFMVGTISANAFRKIDIDRQVARVIHMYSTAKTTVPYYWNFNVKKGMVLEEPSPHPHLRELYTFMLRSLGLQDTRAAHCNYWMCTPEAMRQFIHWFHDSCLPTLLSHPKAMTDSKYQIITRDRQNMLKINQLLRVCGVPYYPHVPFVLERLNQCFFDSVFKGPKYVNITTIPPRPSSTRSHHRHARRRCAHPPRSAQRADRE